MRIFEIDSTDRLWANIRGINLDVDQDFEMAVNILDLLVQLNSPYRVQQLMPTVDTVMQNLVEIMVQILPTMSRRQNCEKRYQICLKN